MATKCVIGTVCRRPKYPKWEVDYAIRIMTEDGIVSVPISSTTHLSKDIQKGAKVIAECLWHENQMLDNKVESHLGTLVHIELVEPPPKVKKVIEKKEKSVRIKEQILKELRENDLPEMEKRIRDYIRSLMSALKR